MSNLPSLPALDLHDTIEAVVEHGCIPRRFAGGFDTFRAETPEMQEVVQRAKEWVKGFEVRKSLGLRLMGPVGIGKTHLTCAVLRTLLAKGVMGRFQNTSDMIAEFRLRFKEDGTESVDGFIGVLAGQDVLALDDFGSEMARDWVADRLYLLINKIYQDMGTIIITGNLRDEDYAERYGIQGRRILSRILDMTENFELPHINHRKGA